MPIPDPSRPAFAVFSHVAQKATATVEQRLREFGDEAALADQVGFDYFFTTEHHFSKRFSLLPSQGVSLTVLAQRTERIRFGSMIYVLPLNNPLRVAEETVILDHMSGGRLEVGFGRGIRPHEHDAYGVVTVDDRAMTVEAMDLILKAWTSDHPFSWNGHYYHHYGIDMPWRPLQLPHPPVWFPTTTEATARSVGESGFSTGSFSFLPDSLNKKCFDVFREGWAAAGRPPEDIRIMWMAPTIVAETDAEARALMREHFPRQIDLFVYEAQCSLRTVGPALAPLLRMQVVMLENLRDDFEAAEKAGAFMYGSPQTVADRWLERRDALGMNVLMSEFSFGELPFEVVQRSVQLTADAVRPLVEKRW